MATNPAPISLVYLYIEELELGEEEEGGGDMEEI